MSLLLLNGGSCLRWRLRRGLADWRSLGRRRRRSDGQSSSGGRHGSDRAPDGRRRHRPDRCRRRWPWRLRLLLLLLLRRCRGLLHDQGRVAGALYERRRPSGRSRRLTALAQQGTVGATGRCARVGLWRPVLCSVSSTRLWQRGRLLPVLSSLSLVAKGGGAVVGPMRVAGRKDERTERTTAPRPVRGCTREKKKEKRPAESTEAESLCVRAGPSGTRKQSNRKKYKLRQTDKCCGVAVCAPVRVGLEVVCFFCLFQKAKKNQRRFCGGIAKNDSAEPMRSLWSHLFFFFSHKAPSRGSDQKGRGPPVVWSPCIWPFF